MKKRGRKKKKEESGSPRRRCRPVFLSLPKSGLPERTASIHRSSSHNLLFIQKIASASHPYRANPKRV